MKKKYDLFTNRIMFPIKDRYENIIALEVGLYQRSTKIY